MPPRSLDRSRRALSEFLRFRREQLAPEEVGLPAVGRRRTKGLRREEVAALAGVGITWYTWLEQGREIGVSAAVLDNIARVLKLDSIDRCHLFLLAHQRPPPTDDLRPWGTVSPLVRQVMDDLVLRPAYAINLVWDVVAWNRAADRLFDFSARDKPNLLRMLFADPAFRRRAPQWQTDAPRLLADFRRDFASAPNDATLGSLIGDLESVSPDFRTWWHGQDADGCTKGLAQVDIDGIGSVDFEHETLVIDEDRRLRLVIYAARPENPGAVALEMLLMNNDKKD
ncbi:helix-turn-helix transcriptional regulator [Reyranella sp. CPCC 100927]|uniref:helix-turn-helix transcriptional regulator n=1 Tax=Reyranella sp. CPCC 100927 TaxID=2599616 RepID=UPI0011B53549|nr:helix-turn-helix transcriptional regulator [Reyranella sp. CPCC 100927]TWT13080.1 helix-turn-helix domain-containing protein [Reyranella sp. CPCC 100927]